MELKLDRQDLYRILASLTHAAHNFDDEAARQHRITAVLTGHPIGVLGGVISEIIAQLFADEGEQLRQLHARLAEAVSTKPGSPREPDPQPAPDKQKDGTSGPSFE